MPMPTLPCNAVVNIESFPKTTVFAPMPTALSPMTILLISELLKPLEKLPIYMELLAVCRADVPLA